MVLFVTGHCRRSCFYCPISEHRRGVDNTYANETLVSCDADLLREARSMDALGTGFTGGEPLLRLNRTLHYIKLLKRSLGAEHYIHLYTGLAPPLRTLRQLFNAGLDEIRLHPPLELWDAFDQSLYCRALTDAKAVGLHAGVEIPAIKDVPVILKAIEHHQAFLNLNELEFSDTNYDEMRARGYTSQMSSYAAAGSEDIAQDIARAAPRAYFCSSTSKDSIQLRERLKRKANNLARDFDEVTEDGTLVYAVIERANDLRFLESLSKERFVVIDGTVHTSWQTAFKLIQEYPALEPQTSIVERYPEGIIVEMTPAGHLLKPKT
ncbi:MAG: radical SAM protein [Euryarchaeota archaeon]|nr:radical SAM protein [Euryarchaeota archaeon]